jgi:hypothetical protein
MTAKPMPGTGALPKVFSYLIGIADVPDAGLDVSISADAATLQALASADGLPKISSLDADFHVVPKSGGRFNVSGEVHAKVTQVCVVSLEPFESYLVEPIDVDFAPSTDVTVTEISTFSTTLIGGEDAVQERDPPDPIIDGKIDLGALASEFFTLGLDPYPRKPGVTFEEPSGGNGEGAASTPFSALRQLKDRS